MIDMDVSRELDANPAECLDKLILSDHPEEFLAEYVRDVGLLYLQRRYVRRLTPTDNVIRHVVHLIHAATIKRRRIRTLECLRVARTLAKRRRLESDLPRDVVRKLFELFQAYCDHPNVEVQWAVTVLIKDEVLDHDAVTWLIENWRKSEHIVNRLLLYPIFDHGIAEWAESVLTSGGIPHRESELISRVIREKIPDFVLPFGDAKILWGIYRADIDVDRKIELMRPFVHQEVIHDVTKIGLRLDRPELLRQVRSSIVEQSHTESAATSRFASNGCADTVALSKLDRNHGS